MAEVGVTERLEHIWLMQTPSRAGPAWRDAFAQACAERGWAFVTHERGDPAPPPAPDRPQLTVSWLDWTEGQPVTRFYVQRGAPQDAPVMLVEQGAVPESEALYEGSLRLACAEYMALNGAVVVSMDDEVILLPGLGEIRRPSGAEHGRDAPDHPLDLYRKAPLSPEASVRWGPEHFVYCDTLAAQAGNGEISLVGRRRLLFTGPPIFLPPGHWRFDGEFSIDPPGETELLIEWGYGDQAQRLPVVISRPGRYSVSLEQAWTRVACADFRISLMIPALDGRLDFHGGVLTRIGDAPEPTSSSSETAETATA